MTLSPDAKVVNETRSQNFDKRFVCHSDFSEYSVELVVRCDGDDESGFLTVWGDRDMIVNRAEVEVDLESQSTRGVADFFDSFLMGEVNQYLRKR